MKKMFIKCLVMLAFSNSLVSCYTYETVTRYRYESAQDDYNRIYKGCTKSQIINDFGAPTRIVPLDGSSVILVYETYTTKIKPPFDPWGLGIGSYTETRNRIFEEFYIGNNSICYNVKTNKVKEVPYQETYRKSIFE